MNNSLVKENYPIYLTDMLSAASVYTTGNELNYCLNTTVGVRQVRRHGIQPAEYKWPITQHDVIAEHWEEKEELPPLHPLCIHTHTVSNTHAIHNPPLPPPSWIWKGKQRQGWVEVGYVVVFLFTWTLMFPRSFETFCSRPRREARLQASVSLIALISTRCQGRKKRK